MSSPHQRPLSPHLQIYKLPLTALISIAHRITGVINSIGAILLVFVLAAAAGGQDSYATAEWILTSWLGTLILFGFTLTLYYHFCNGIRHLFWDTGLGFEVETANKTARLTLVAAGVLTVLTWIVALAAG
ncbi:MAG: succinate dehydrogenase, cytochrome b556 subunit [Gammaproteobacteria bacterium]|nr:succinate dehydrogenase, cytochrome b556 subunit [Gammaproteobacteria bacterium]